MNYIKLWYTAYIYGLLGNGGGGPSNQQLVFQSAAIDGTTAGGSSLFTVVSQYDFFIPGLLNISTGVVDNFNSAPVLSVGSNATAYNNLFSSDIPLEGLDDSSLNNEVFLGTAGMIISDGVGTPMGININTAADADTYDIYVTLTGLGINIPDAEEALRIKKRIQERMLFRAAHQARVKTRTTGGIKK